MEKSGAITLDRIGLAEKMNTPDKQLVGNRKLKEQALSISRHTKNAKNEISKLNERFEMDTVFPFLIPNQAAIKDLEEKKKSVQNH